MPLEKKLDGARCVCVYVTAVAYVSHNMDMYNVHVPFSRSNIQLLLALSLSVCNWHRDTWPSLFYNATFFRVLCLILPANMLHIIQHVHQSCRLNTNGLTRQPRPQQRGGSYL